MKALHRWLVADDAAKVKLFGISALLVVALAWLGINAASALIPEPAARPLDTPGWKLVQELNEALAKEPGFESTCFVVKSEDPLRLELVGAVACAEDLADLKGFAAQIRPERDFDLAVELLDAITNTQPTVEPEPAGVDGEPADNG